MFLFKNTSFNTYCSLTNNEHSQPTALLSLFNLGNVNRTSEAYSISAFLPKSQTAFRHLGYPTALQHQAWWVRACVLSPFSCVRLFAPLWTLARQVPLSVGFSRQEYCSGLPCPCPGDLPNPGIEPASLISPALAGRFFTTSATWEAPETSLLRWLGIEPSSTAPKAAMFTTIPPTRRGGLFK